MTQRMSKDEVGQAKIPAVVNTSHNCHGHLSVDTHQWQPLDASKVPFLRGYSRFTLELCRKTVFKELCGDRLRRNLYKFDLRLNAT